MGLRDIPFWGRMAAEVADATLNEMGARKCATKGHLWKDARTIVQEVRLPEIGSGEKIQIESRLPDKRRRQRMIKVDRNAESVLAFRFHLQPVAQALIGVFAIRGQAIAGMLAFFEMGNRSPLLRSRLQPHIPIGRDAIVIENDFNRAELLIAKHGMKNILVHQHAQPARFQIILVIHFQLGGRYDRRQADEHQEGANHLESILLKRYRQADQSRPLYPQQALLSLSSALF